MNTKNQQSKQVSQNQGSTKVQHPPDPQYRQSVNSQKLGVNDIKEAEQRQSIGV